MSSGTEKVEVTAETADRVRANFVDGDKLKVIPARRNAKLVIFAWLAERFNLAERYPETEVNRILGHVHPDFATLRRGLYDEHFVDRADGLYWRTPEEQRLVIRPAARVPLLETPRLILRQWRDSVLVSRIPGLFITLRT